MWIGISSKMQYAKYFGWMICRILSLCLLRTFNPFLFVYPWVKYSQHSMQCFVSKHPPLAWSTRWLHYLEKLVLYLAWLFSYFAWIKLQCIMNYSAVLKYKNLHNKVLHVQLKKRVPMKMIKEMFLFCFVHSFSLCLIFPFCSWYNFFPFISFSTEFQMNRLALWLWLFKQKRITLYWDVCIEYLTFHAKQMAQQNFERIYSLPVHANKSIFSTDWCFVSCFLLLWLLLLLFLFVQYFSCRWALECHIGNDVD